MLDLTQVDCSPWANWALYALLAVNLAVFSLQVPLSSLHLVVILRTAVLHRNLKFVLFAQSSFFCGYAACRVAQMAIVFARGLNHWLDYKALQTDNNCVNCKSAVSFIVDTSSNLTPALKILIEKLFEEDKQSTDWFKSKLDDITDGIALLDCKRIGVTGC